MAKRSFRAPWILLLAFCGPWSGVSPVRAQLPSSVSVIFPDGSESVLPVEAERGYPAIAGGSLNTLGWTVHRDRVGGGVVLRHRTGLELGLRPGSPFVVWDDLLVQMVDSPYWRDETCSRIRDLFLIRGENRARAASSCCGERAVG